MHYTLLFFLLDLKSVLTGRKQLFIHVFTTGINGG